VGLRGFLHNCISYVAADISPPVTKPTPLGTWVGSSLKTVGPRYVGLFEPSLLSAVFPSMSCSAAANCTGFPNNCPLSAPDSDVAGVGVSCGLLLWTTTDQFIGRLGVWGHVLHYCGSFCANSTAQPD
jgi:hypothetical protein